MVARLDSIRQNRLILIEGKLDYSRADPEYSGAFRQYGLDLRSNPSSVAFVRQSMIRKQLLDALDDWAIICSTDQIQRNQLLAIGHEVDPDTAWRDQFRDPAIWKDKGRMEHLLTSMSSDSLSPLPARNLHPSLTTGGSRRFSYIAESSKPLFRRLHDQPDLRHCDRSTDAQSRSQYSPFL